MEVALGTLTLDGLSPRIAVPFRDGLPDEHITAARQLGMDIAELRIDLFTSLDRRHVLNEIKRFKSIPLLATIRSAAEGGSWNAPDEQRLDLFATILPEVDAVDVELSSSAILAPVVDAARAHGKCVVVSFHDFQKTPTLKKLESFADQAKTAGADIVKVAARCASHEDLRTLAHYTLNHREKGLVTIGMGAAGMMTRICFPALGSLFTFASYGEGTAPGQLSLEETAHYLRDFYSQPESAPEA